MHPSASDAFPGFRPVPRTGVIYVMSEAARRGFHYGSKDWANLGQGAPETGVLPGSPPRVDRVEVAPASLEYAPVDGLRELREAVANLYNARYRRGKASQYTADNVCISPGGRSALTRIAASLGPVHLGHVLPDYTAYEELLGVFRDFVPIPIPLREEDGFRLPVDALRERVVSMGLGAVLLSNPCNPTGHVVAGDELASWVATMRELRCVLVLDEFYAHYVYDRDVPVSAAAYVDDVDRDPVVIVDGLTKNWRYPGWRLSWTVGPASVIRGLASAGSFLDGGAPHPLQQAAIPLLAPAVADAEAAAIRACFRAKRDLVVERCQRMGLDLPAPPEGAFYVFPGLGHLRPALRDGLALFEAALERQVICVPGAFFDIDPGNRRSAFGSRLASRVRLSFGPDVETLTRGLDRLEALVAGG